MPVKSGNCVRTGAAVLVLEYGFVQKADVFLIGDCILLNFGASIFEGYRPDIHAPCDYEVCIGMNGFWHEGKNVLVVPKHQFKGSITHRDGRLEQLELRPAAARRIVLDVTGGALQGVSAGHDVDVLMISYDSDDFSDAEKMVTDMEGKQAAAWGSSWKAEPQVLDHYAKEFE